MRSSMGGSYDNFENESEKSFQEEQSYKIKLGAPKMASINPATEFQSKKEQFNIASLDVSGKIDEKKRLLKGKIELLD